MSRERDIAETERTRANLLQVGRVTHADYAQARLRVDLAGLKTAWLPWLTRRAGGNRAWEAPEVGEQVLVACPDGDPAGGVVLGALYQADHAAPAASADLERTVYADGAVIEYDRAAHALKALLPSGATALLVATGGVTVQGNTTIQGTLNVTQTITSGGDQLAAGISQTGHVHSGVDAGNSYTGVPQ